MKIKLPNGQPFTVNKRFVRRERAPSQASLEGEDFGAFREGWHLTSKGRKRSLSLASFHFAACGITEEARARIAFRAARWRARKAKERARQGHYVGEYVAPYKAPALRTVSAGIVCHCPGGNIEIFELDPLTQPEREPAHAKGWARKVFLKWSKSRFPSAVWRFSFAYREGVYGMRVERIDKDRRNLPVYGRKIRKLRP